MEHTERKDVEMLHEAMQEPAQVARYLRALADGLEAGHLRLRSGGREVELHPRNLCSFELRSSSERQRVKLQLQLAWREASVNPRDDQFEITSK
jgi:amphi-Trp domain-containing protein